MSLKLIVEAADTVNVALNQPATQSSVSQWSVSNESGRAVNGHRSGSYSFHTLFEPNPWWKVDLQRPYPIDAIVVWNRDDEYAVRASTLCIHVSLDGIEWLLVLQGRTFFRGARTSRPLVHMLEGKVQARFVRISLEGESALHLDQVEVLVSKNAVVMERFWHEAGSDPVGNDALLAAPQEYEVVSGARADRDTKISALKLKRFGRFGNNFHQLLNAAILAKALEIGEIVLDRGMLLTPVPKEAIDGLRFRDWDDPDFGRAMCGRFYFIAPFARVFDKTSLDTIYETLTDTIQPLYSDLLNQAEPPSIKRSMHFHFRGGDVFDDKKPLHRAYAQPPLAFYQAALSHAIEHFGVEAAVIVYEDKTNPCVEAFTQFLSARSFPYSEHSGALTQDLLELLSAKIICYGFGTFVESILCVSRHAEVAYAFREIEAFAGENMPDRRGIKEILLRKGLTLHLVKDSAGAYIAKHKWVKSSEQRELMVSYPQQSLEIIKL
jgi:F5/8 type C domain